MFQNVMKAAAVFSAGLALLPLTGCDLFPGADAISVVATVTTIHTPSDTTAARVYLSKNLVPVTNAEVDLNGVKCVEYLATGTYSRSFSPAIAADADVLLTIKKAGTTLDISKTLTMPFPPANALIVTAGAGGSYEAREPIGIEWDPVSDAPTRLDILITSGYTRSGKDFLKYVWNSVHSFTIAADTIKSDQVPPPPSSNLPVPIHVVSVNLLFLAGPEFEFGSMFSVGNAATVPIYTNP